MKQRRNGAHQSDSGSASEHGSGKLFSRWQKITALLALVVPVLFFVLAASCPACFQPLDSIFGSLVGHARFAEQLANFFVLPGWAVEFRSGFQETARWWGDLSQYPAFLEALRHSPGFSTPERTLFLVLFLSFVSSVPLAFACLFDHFRTAVSFYEEHGFVGYNVAGYVFLLIGINFVLFIFSIFLFQNVGSFAQGGAGIYVFIAFSYALPSFLFVVQGGLLGFLLADVCHGIWLLALSVARKER